MLIQCADPKCGLPKIGYYPSRQSVANKLSPYRYCQPSHQQRHWRQRNRAVRLAAKPIIHCHHCGTAIRPTLRPGRPRRYCSPEHQQAAANKRRPPTSPQIAFLEDQRSALEVESQAAWAELAKHPGPETAAEYQAREQPLQTALHQAEAAQRELYASDPTLPPALEALREAEVEQRAAWAEFNAINDAVGEFKTKAAQLAARPKNGDRRRSAERRLEDRRTILQAGDLVGVQEASGEMAVQEARDALNSLQRRSVEAEEKALVSAKASLDNIQRDAELARPRAAVAADARYAAQRRADELAGRVEGVTELINRAKRRLARRARDARRRRATAAGVEPEAQDQDVHQVDVDRARRDPEYAAWLRRQGLL